MHLGIKTGPLCPMFCIKLKGALFLLHSSRSPPYLIPNYLRVQKKRNPGINGKVTMYRCLLSDFYLTGALRKILTGVPCCGALLELWMTLNLNPAGLAENLLVQKKELRYNIKITMYNCLLREFHPTGALRRIFTGVASGPGSSVGIATDDRLDGPGSNPGGDEIFRSSRPALGPNQPPVEWVPGLSWG